MKIYSIYDSKLEAYMTPFFAQTAGVAIRMFQQAAQDEKHEFHRHAADYTLFEVGLWDDIKGETKNHKANISLTNALELQETSHIQGTNGGLSNEEILHSALRIQNEEDARNEKF